MKTKAPVGLEKGDEFETPLGNLEVLGSVEDQYHMRDIETGEEVWFSHDTLVEIMVANIHGD